MYYSEAEAAVNFAREHDGSIKYDHASGRWFIFNGNIWRPDLRGKVRSLAHDFIMNETEGMRDLGAQGKARSKRVVDAVEGLARTIPGLTAGPADWDPDPLLLGTPAGTLDLRNGKVREPERQDGITRGLAVAPAQEPACPRWVGFLRESTGGDEGVMSFLKMWCGYSVTGETKEHALLFIFGPGGNGKSVFINTVAGIFGDYAATAPMDAFTASTGDRHPTDLAMLRGARLVTATETEEGRTWAEARVKQMTGGDKIAARFMRQDFFTYVPQFKLTLVGNHMPALRNVDEAMRRRFNIVPFVLKPQNPDRDLEAKLRAEWPGILRWMIDGYQDYAQHGLVRSESIRAATEGYFEDEDMLGTWVKERCDTGPDLWDRPGDLFASWSAYATRNGEQAGDLRRFRSGLERLGFRHQRSHGVRRVIGIRSLE